MTPQEHREVFVSAIFEWLEMNGVTFGEVTEDSPPFTATLDLNVLKLGMVGLIHAFGGNVDL
jgi:hypothetical protein